MSNKEHLEKIVDLSVELSDKDVEIHSLKKENEELSFQIKCLKEETCYPEPKVDGCLTQLWNIGKLPEGDYYLKRRNGDYFYDNIDSHGVWRNTIDEDIVDVLGTIPDWYEWDMINKDLRKKLTLAYQKNEENEKLKELLTESLEVISENSRLSEAIGRERVLGRNKALIKRIKEALK